MKRCSRCGQDKPVEEFPGANGDTRRSWCKPCKNAYDRDWYRRNKQKHIQDVNELKRQVVERNQALIREAKSVPCADCGVRYPWYVMDFDHVGADKDRNISQAFRYWWPKRLLAEINKCDVVCVNCHRERTYGPGRRLQCHSIQSDPDQQTPTLDKGEL